MTELLEILSNTLETAKNVTAIVKDISGFLSRRVRDATTEDGENQYESRVSARREAGEYRPEWELIGRTVFNENGNQVITEMEQVPQRLRNTMKASILTGRLSSTSSPLEITEGHDSYLLEIAGIPRREALIFAFFWKPTSLKARR